MQSIPQDDGPIELCYSTGKDSDVILELAKMADIPFVAIYKNTTCDRIGSIPHAREMGVEIWQPKKNMLQLIEEKGWPSRWKRFCCEYLKEYKIHNRAVLGIRREESSKRAARYNEPELCRVYSKSEKVRQYFPILDWTNDDVRRFVEDRRLKLHPHYYDEQGNLRVERRVGCIGCPMQGGNGVADFKDNPKFFRGRVKAFVRWYEQHPDSKTAKIYPSAYHALYQKLFCHDMQEYYLHFEQRLFADDVDIKNWLEDYFRIDL